MTRQLDNAFLDEMRRAYPFPDPREADEHGLIGWGGDLSAGRLLSAYASGIFPWFDEPPFLWFSPEPRAVLPVDALHVGRSLAKRVRKQPYELRLDTAFERVIRACASTERPDQLGTWITPEMIDAYSELHREGFAHSVEAWHEGELVGGLYGISLGAAFFGESMFSLASDASKIAFVALVRQLEAWGFEFVDCQLENDHVMRFGTQLWSRDRYLVALAAALEQPTRAGPWAFDPPGDG